MCFDLSRDARAAIACRSRVARVLCVFRLASFVFQKLASFWCLKTSEIETYLYVNIGSVYVTLDQGYPDVRLCLAGTRTSTSTPWFIPTGGRAITTRLIGGAIWWAHCISVSQRESRVTQRGCVSTAREADPVQGPVLSRRKKEIR